MLLPVNPPPPPSFDVDNAGSGGSPASGRFPLDSGSPGGLVLQNMHPGRRESFLYRLVRG